MTIYQYFHFVGVLIRSNRALCHLHRAPLLRFGVHDSRVRSTVRDRIAAVVVFVSVADEIHNRCLCHFVNHCLCHLVAMHLSIRYLSAWQLLAKIVNDINTNYYYRMSWERDSTEINLTCWLAEYISTIFWKSDVNFSTCNFCCLSPCLTTTVKRCKSFLVIKIFSFVDVWIWCL